MQADYRRRRLLTFMDPWADPLGDGFQIIQSLIAVGTGGVFGKGLMSGVQKLFYLPEPYTDFIFAVISEETGLLGATLVVLCFCVIAWRGLRTAMRAPDSFGAFLALGITMMLVLQAFVNISVVLGLLPTKGIPLPLVSNGGSSMLINLLGVGVLLNISQHSTDGDGSRVTGARADRGRRHRRAPVPGHRAGARAAAARSVDAGVVRRHGAGRRGARGAAREVSARPDSRGRPEGQVAARALDGVLAAAARGRRRVARRRRSTGPTSWSASADLRRVRCSLLAALRGYPTMLLEQNALPGITNRLLARVVRAAAVNFEEALAYFPAHGICGRQPRATGVFPGAERGGE